MRDLRSIRQLRSVRGVSGGASPFNPKKLDSITQWLFKEPNTSTQAVDTIGAETRPIRKPRCYDFSVASSSIKATAPSGDIHSVSAINMAGGIVDGSVSYASGVHTITFTEKVYNIKLWATGTVTDAQKKAVTLEGSGGQSELYAWHVGQEESGAVAFDISGNGNHSNIQSSSLVDFHAIDKDVCKSWANDVGYSHYTEVIQGTSQLTLGSSQAFKTIYFEGAASSNTTNQALSIELGSQYLMLAGSAASINPGKFGVFGSVTQWLGSGVEFEETTMRKYIWQINTDNTVSFFQDGVLIGTSTATISQNLSKIAFGFGGGSGGFVHNFRVYNKELSATEKAALINGEDVTDGLTLHYSGSGDTPWEDLVGNNNATQAVTKQVVIPRNEAIPTEDVLGNALQYTGRVKYNNDIVASPCGNFDGVVDKITFSDLTGVSITSYQGTATPTIVGNEIQCTAGTLYNLVLSNGWHFPFTEKSGLTIHNKADENNPGTLVTGDEVAFWRETQNVYHDFLGNGGSRGVNMISYSEELDQWTNYNGSTVVTDVNTAPDGETTADTVLATSPILFQGVVKSGITITAGGQYSYSVYLKKEVSETNYGGVGLVLAGVSTETLYVIFDAVLGTYAVSGSTITPDNVSVDDFGAYWRLSIVFTETQGNTSLTNTLYGTLSTNFSSLSTGVGSARTYWGVQLEEGATPTTYQRTFSDGNEGQVIPALNDGSGNDTLGNPLQYPAGNHWNYPPSKLLAPEAPALTCPFVHGGTFDGSHYADLSAPVVLDLTKDFVCSYYIKDLLVSVNNNIVLGNSIATLPFISYHSLSYLRVNSDNGSTADFTGFGSNTYTTGKFELVKSGANLTLNVYSLGGVLVDTSTISWVNTGTLTINRIGGRNADYFLIGRLSGLKLIEDGVTLIDEPLNGTLNNATLTGSAATFWVPEHNNLMFDSNGNAINYDPADINGNYLGLNRIFSDKSNPKKLDNIIVLDEPATGADLQKILKYTNQ